MQRLISALQPTPAYWDAKHTAGHVQSPFTYQCGFALNQRPAETNHDQLPYTASSSKHSARQYEHSEPMASLGNRTSVLQAARTHSIHAERCLPVHAGQRCQHYRTGTPSSGSLESLKARGRETGSFHDGPKQRGEVTPGLNQPFFAFTWLRLRSYAHSSRAPRLLRAGAIHAPQIDLLAALASWASGAVSMTGCEASWRKALPEPLKGGVRLVALRPLCRNIQTLICGGAGHD